MHIFNIYNKLIILFHIDIVPVRAWHYHYVSYLRHLQKMKRCIILDPYTLVKKNKIKISRNQLIDFPNPLWLTFLLFFEWLNQDIKPNFLNKTQLCARNIFVVIFDDVINILLFANQKTLGTLD